MSDIGSVTTLLRQARAGDEQARALLRSRMSQLVKAIARWRLDASTRRNVGDEEDVEASVGANFFKDDDKLARLDATDRSHLEATLSKAARDKVVDYQRKAHRRIDPIRDSDVPTTGESDETGFAPVAAINGAAAAYELAEKLEGLSAQHLQVAEWLIQGYSEREIAVKLGATRYRVTQFLQDILAVLESSS